MRKQIIMDAQYIHQVAACFTEKLNYMQTDKRIYLHGWIQNYVRMISKKSRIKQISGVNALTAMFHKDT